MATWIPIQSAMLGLLRSVLTRWKTRKNDQAIVKKISDETKAIERDLLIKALKARQTARAGYLSKSADNVDPSGDGLSDNPKN